LSERSEDTAHRNAAEGGLLMSRPNRTRRQGGSGGGGGGRARASVPQRIELWRRVPVLPDPELIAPAADPTALLRSLGPPPLPGQGAVAEHYLAAVIGRAAVVATALAGSADLLAQPEADG